MREGPMDWIREGLVEERTFELKPIGQEPAMWRAMRSIPGKWRITGTEGVESTAASRDRNKPGVERADAETSRYLVVHGLQILF